MLDSIQKNKMIYDNQNYGLCSNNFNACQNKTSVSSGHVYIGVQVCRIFNEVNF